jgi:predicted phosphate transport protein (TIGR00153 family)
LFKRDKKLWKRGEELYEQLAKELQITSAKLANAIVIWANHDKDPDARSKILHLKDEIVKAERRCDDIKEELINSIFAKGAYLPQATEDRHRLVRYMDNIVNKTEVVIRRLCAREDFPARIPHEMPLLAEKVHQCTDYLQDALKYLDSDYEKARKYAVKVDNAREEARDLDFHIFGRINSPDYDAKDAYYCYKISVSLVVVAEAAEQTSDYIQTMTVKYGT